MDWRLEYIDLEKVQRLMEKTEGWDEERQRKFYLFLLKRKDKLFQTGLGENFVDIYAKKLEREGIVLPQREMGKCAVPEKKTLRALVWRALPACLLAVAVSAGSIWVYQKVEDMDAKRHLEDLQETLSVSGAPSSEEPAQQEKDPVQTAVVQGDSSIESAGVSGQEKPPVLEKYRELSDQYPELFGWLTIPDTRINYPVMQSATEKDYYLHHSYEGRPDDEGALFVDPASVGYPMDDNIVVYGHNMKNGHLFGELKNYSVESYFQNNREILFDTLYETSHYEVVTVVQTHIKSEAEDGFRYYQFFNYGTQEEFQACVDFIQENQIYDVENKLQYGDKLLMLSTCDYAQDNGRFVVIARKMVQ